MKNNSLTAQQIQALNWAAYMDGDIATAIALQALRNSAKVIGVEHPSDITSIRLPDGITRYNERGRIEFCFRADIQSDLHHPRKGAEERLTQEFNAVAAHHGFPACYRVRIFQCVNRQVMIAAEVYYPEGGYC